MRIPWAHPPRGDKTDPVRVALISTATPDGGGYELKQAIAARHGVRMDQICLGKGSNDVLDMAAPVFSSVQDKMASSLSTPLLCTTFPWFMFTLR